MSRTSMPGPNVVVIGGSAGGMKALRDILQTLTSLETAFGAVVLHRPPQDSPLVEVLQTYTNIPIHEPSDSPWSCPQGAITVAPAGFHLLVGNDRVLVNNPPTPVAVYHTEPGIRAHLALDRHVAYSRPSIDVTFFSAAELMNPVTAVLLSCANEDGAAGCEAIKRAGGKVVLQDPATCEATSAVLAAQRLVEPDHVADPEGIGRWLAQTLGSR